MISHYPAQLGVLAEVFYLQGHEVHVKSAIGKARIGTTDADGHQEWPGFRAERIHEVVFDSPRESPELKFAKCEELGITIFFDDRRRVPAAQQALHPRMMVVLAMTPPPHTCLMVATGVCTLIVVVGILPLTFTDHDE